MNTRPFAYFALVALLAVSCQSDPPVPATHLTTQSTPNAPAPAVPAYKSPMLPDVAIKPEARIRLQGSRVTLEVKLPPVSADRGAFTTQQLDLATAAKLTATVRDSYGKTYSPDGADGNGQVVYPANGVINLNFTGVIPDELLFIELQVTDSTTDIPQADLATVVKNIGLSDVTTSMNFQTTPTAKTMKALLTADATRARAINLTDLTALMTGITGVTGTSPNFSYTCHPTLVDTAALATALRTQDPGVLTPAAYRLTGATVGLSVSGLVGSDTLEVQATDAASARKLTIATGNTSLTGATPGTGLKLLVGATAGNSTQYSFTVTPNSNLTLTNGASTPVTIVATPATVNLTNIAPGAEAIGNSVILTGTGFSTTAANNIVTFGSTTATVTAATDTSLTVTVPPGLFGTQNVTVSVGTSTSGARAFNVKPVISTAPDHATVGTSITLIGKGFDPTASNNTVTFGSIPATVTGATANSLTVTVPNGAGAQNIAVTVAGQVSNSKAFNVTPTLSSLLNASSIVGSSITLNGSGFDTTPAHNTVSFNGATATVTAATATSLTVTVPAGFGSRSVSVTVDSQTSDSLLHAVIPNITFTSNQPGRLSTPFQIIGTGFDLVSASNNIVMLGTTPLSVTISGNNLIVTDLPMTIPAGPQAYTVQVGTETSLPGNASVKPILDAISTSAGTLLDKTVLIRGQTLTLTGGHFDPVPAHNSVKFKIGATTVTAAADTATSSQLTVTIPGGVDLVGNVLVTVVTNGEYSSDSLTGVVPTITLNVPDGGFY